MTGLYIHIPFCVQKCKYCDFTSYAGLEHLTDKYIKALENEMKQYRGEAIDTIFWGGGTPTVLTAHQMSKLAEMCFRSFDVQKDYEFTAEANPGTLDDEKVTAMLEGGINRISVGVQSFNDSELHAIGRIHNAETAYNTVYHLKKMGFNNINIDIMTALPSQTRESLESTLKTAVSLPVTHISAYSLIIEEGTPLEREYSLGRLLLPDDDTDRLMYRDTVGILKNNDFLQYEISNFARRGFKCRHNIKYWTGEKYIGLGASAHSYDGEKRFYNTSDINAYLAHAPAAMTALKRQDKISEFMITGLRMTEGISAKEFKTRFDIAVEEIYGAELRKFEDLGLMRHSDGRYALTERGIDISNSVLCEFV